MVVRIINGDVREMLATIPDNSIDCCVTSPPYWGLRDYGVEGQIGLEPTPQEYFGTMVEVFREVRRVLKPEGTLWLNIGDSYAGSGPSGASYQSKTTKRRAEVATDGAFRISKRLEGRGLTYAEKKPVAPPGFKKKDLIMIPNRLAILLQEDGWYVRSEIIWHKPNPMPESVRDRPTSAHEKVWLLTKSDKYFYDADAIAEEALNSGKIVKLGEKSFSKGQAKGAGVKPSGNGLSDTYTVPSMRNARNVWSISPKPFKGAHFAVMPHDLVERCIKAGCPEGGMVLDPFGGSGTTGLVADNLGRDAVLIELNSEYVKLADDRIVDNRKLI